MYQSFHFANLQSCNKQLDGKLPIDSTYAYILVSNFF